jgi:type I restriction enzyme, S subunit
MSELPEGWAHTTLSELCVRIVDGSHNPPKAADAGKPMLSARNIQGGRINFDNYRVISDADFEIEGRRTCVAVNDVLLTIVGTIGRVAVVQKETPEFALQRSVAVLKPNSAIAAQYLRYALESPRVQQHFVDTAKGTAQKGVYLKALGELAIELAPLPEQTRIANQLDTLLTRIQSCNDRFDAIPALLKRFRQAVLDAAVSGSLTHPWKTALNAADWSTTTVSSICQKHRVITYGVVKLGEEVPSGTPCLRTSNVRWLRFELDGMKRIAPTLSAEYSRTILRGGEVLVNVRGTLGGVAVAGHEMVGWNISREVAVLPVEQSIVDPRFAAYWVASDASQKWLAGMEKGIAYVGINIEDLRSLPIRLPSLPEQAEIVRRVEALFALADRIEARATSARIQAQRLSPLVLAKAFRGELVQQDPQDEPASVLLQRLAATQPAKAKASRGRPRTKTQELFATPEGVQPDAAGLPDGVWAAPEAVDEHAVTAMLVAVLKAWGGPMPQMQARLAAVLCLQPRQMTAALPAEQAVQWQRLVGPVADPLPTQVARLQPATDGAWRKALLGMRARGDLVEEGSGPQAVWALGPGAGQMETAGWPEGRAGWVVAYLRAQGAEAILPLLEPLTVEFVHARAA